MNKKIKKFKIIIITIFFSLCLIGCGEEEPNNPINPDPIVDENKNEVIGLELSDIKTKYELLESFDKGDLKVNAIYSNSSKIDVTSKVNVDSSLFNNTKDGTCEIIISYEENGVTAKSFYFAVVGTGEESGGGEIIDPIVKTFGPGTYTMDASIDLATYPTSMVVVNETLFADGYYTLLGDGAKRANASSYALELPKNESAWIEFNVTGSATITVNCSSTGSTNTSVIALFDGENSLVNNNEGITTVTSTNITKMTYTVTTGTYRILSPSETSYSTRGVRIYSVIVIQK